MLLKLFPVNERYRTAGIFSLITQVLQGLFLLLWGNAAPSWSLIFTLPALGISLLGNFHEFHAHSELLWGLDSLLAEKWERLWTWNIASTGIFIGGTVLALLIDVVGLLLALAGTIGMLAVSILTPIYLYQTAKALTYSVATAAEQ